MFVNSVHVYNSLLPQVAFDILNDDHANWADIEKTLRELKDQEEVIISLNNY